MVYFFFFNKFNCLFHDTETYNVFGLYDPVVFVVESMGDGRDSHWNARNHER